jgi:hypothetical protein
MRRRNHPAVSAVAVLMAMAVLLAGLAGSTALAATDIKTVSDHKPLKPGEHPRLIYRSGQLGELRKVAATEDGNAIVERIEQATRLMKTLAFSGGNRTVLKEGGFRAAGHAALYVTTGQKKQAVEAFDVLEKQILNYPMVSRLGVVERANRLYGVAVTYDLCYDAWTAKQRRDTRAFLKKEAKAALEGFGNPDKPNPSDCKHIITLTSGALAQLAILGDEKDDGARKRLGKCEKAILHYLDKAIGSAGIGLYGEAQKFAAMASGIMPYAHASRIALGRSFDHHPALKTALTTMAYQAVKGAGIPQYGPVMSGWDRSGLFAEGMHFTPEQKRPGVVWLFHQVGGKKYKGVVRPHQGLYMLLYFPLEMEPEAPDWPTHLYDPEADFVLFRNRWRDQNDLVVTAFDGGLRITGMGGRYGARAGKHAFQWAPREGRIRNQFGLHYGLYRQKVERTITKPVVDAKAATGVVTFRVKGEGKARPQKAKKKKKNEERKAPPPTPPAGKFEGTRCLAVDFSNAHPSGALIVTADRLANVDKAIKAWILHAGAKCKITAEGDTFKIASSAATLTGKVIAKEPMKVENQSAGHQTWLWNFAGVTGPASEVLVVMTIDRGDAPKIKVKGDGLDAKVTVGKRRIQVRDGKVVFSE